ncbi:FAD-dependent oxidoreductase, partial [bacterium]
MAPRSCRSTSHVRRLPGPGAVLPGPDQPANTAVSDSGSGAVQPSRRTSDRDVVIDRDPDDAAAGSSDLLVIGGGMYGAVLALEAARRGISTLLLERGDFGRETTWSSLRILHGGLRYLQRLDLPRFRESVGERRWFLRCFPDLVEPLPCLMPLHDPPRGGRLRRPGIFRFALRVNDLLARERALPPGRLLSAAETVELFPGVDRAGLRGGALWYDAVAKDPE